MRKKNYSALRLSMLSTITSRFVSAGVLIVFLIAAGIYIHRTGKPYQSVVFGIHKISTIAMIVILTMVVIQFFRGIRSGPTQLVLPGTLILSLAGLLFTGAMMSLDRLQAFMLLIHRVFTVVFLISFFFLGYLVFTFATQLKN